VNQWLVICLAGAATMLIRTSMFFVPPRVLPATARGALRYVTPAVLGAFIAQQVLYPSDEGFNAGLGNEWLLAAIVAAAVAWATSNVWLTIAVGMMAVWLLDAVS
jgi:branched-subunit amino acid transport protein